MGAGNPVLEIDLILPGLGRGNGRSEDRFRVSAETRDPVVRDARVDVVRRIAERAALDPELWIVLRARLDRELSTREIHEAYLDDARGLSGVLRLARRLEQRSHRTLGEWLALYRKSYRRRDAKRTFARLTRLIEAIGPARWPDALTPATVTQALDELTAEHSGATRNRYRAALSGFASYLVRMGALERHPVAFQQVPKAEEGEQRLPSVTPEELRRYFESIADVPIDVRLVLRMLLSTGADVGELIPTRENRGEGLLLVRQLELAGEERQVMLKRSKVRSSRHRIVPIPESLALDLRAFIRLRGLEANDPVFGEVEYGRLYRAHRRGRAAIGQPELRLKDFRHLAAISWRRAGADIFAVRDRLGHTSVNQSMIYVAYKADAAEERASADAAERVQTGDVSLRLIA